MKKVSLVILNWNGARDTLECLETVRKLNTKEFSLNVVVVDNWLKSDSIDVLKKIKDIKLIINKKNLGFAAGNNVGVKYAFRKGADYVVIMNNDIYLEKNSIHELFKLIDSDKKIGAVSPKVYFAKGFEFKKRYKKEELGKVFWYAGGIIDWDNVYGSTRGVDEVDRGQLDEVGETEFVTGTCMIISKEIYKKVGAFDEKYFMYYEDTDLSQRIKRAGYKVVFDAKSVIWHKVAQGSGIGSELNDYFITRNRMMFGMRYARLRTKLALFRESLRLLISGRKWQRIGIRDYYLLRFGKGSWK